MHVPTQPPTLPPFPSLPPGVPLIPTRCFRSFMSKTNGFHFPGNEAVTVVLVLQALIARGVIGDFRAPNVLRFGFAPLYTRYVDVWLAIDHLREVMEREEWKLPEHQTRKLVT
jgi:hypothetical protein